MRDIKVSEPTNNGVQPQKNAVEPENNAAEPICNDMRHGVSSKFDCKFVVGDPSKAETVFGCKYLFAIESPVFEKMLLGDFKEAQNPTEGIPLPDDDPQAMRHFRLFTCCTERTSRMQALSLAEAMNLAQFSNKYMALSISKLCNDRLMSMCETLSVLNLIKVFGCAHNCLETIYERVNVKLGQNSYPLHAAALNDINQDAFKEYLHCHRQLINHSTVGVFYAIVSYLNHNDLIPENLLETEEENKKDGPKTANKTDVDNAENLALQADKRKRTFIRDLLRDFNFSKMDVSSFLAGPGDSNILTLEQKYYILTSLCRKQTLIKLFEN